MAIYNVRAWVARYSRRAPLIAVEIDTTARPSTVTVTQGAVDSGVQFSQSGDRVSFSFVQTVNTPAMIDAGGTFVLDPLIEIDEYEDDEGDDPTPTRPYPEDAPGVVDPESGMIDTTALRGLWVPLADLNTMRLEVQLLDDLNYPTWVRDEVHVVNNTHIYNDMVFSPEFGELEHPSMHLDFSFRSTYLRFLPNYESGEPLQWQALVQGLSNRVVQSSFRLIARNVEPVKLGNRVHMDALYDYRLYEYDYFCDYIEGQEIRSWL